MVADGPSGDDPPNVSGRRHVGGDRVGEIRSGQDFPDVAPRRDLAGDVVSGLNQVDRPARGLDLLRDRVRGLDFVDVAGGGDRAIDGIGRDHVTNEATGGEFVVHALRRDFDKWGRDAFRKRWSRSR